MKQNAVKVDMEVLEHKPLTYPGVKEGLYEIYSDGKIWSNYKKGFMTPIKDKDGYLKIQLSGGTRNNKITIKIHKLVLIHFGPTPPTDIKDLTVNHIDFNKENNCISNLEWMSRTDNTKNRQSNPIGEKNPSAKLTQKDVIEIINLLQTSSLTLQEIGDKYNVHKTTILKIKQGKTWKQINPFSLQ